MSVAVHHVVEGPQEAEPLVLSNSIGTDLGIWDDQAPALAERFRLIRYDHRGHGGTPAPPGPYTMEDLGRDVLALLDELELERASFCGISIGGMIGLWLAVNAPERIDRLALCCTSAHMPPAEAWSERAATVRAEGMAAVTDASLERWFTPALAERRPATRERVRRMLLATSPEGYAACCEAIGGHDLRAELAAIRAPTLVIAGAEDPSTPPDHGRLIADAVGGARLLVLQGPRHLANVERPDEVTRALLDHFTGEEASA